MKKNLNIKPHLLRVYYELWDENKLSSVESQKGAITIQRCSVENQKGAIAVQSLW